jgi:hypothetical protein
MNGVRRALALVLAFLIVLPAAPARAQHVVDRSALDQAIRDRVARDASDRAAIRALLQRAEVREIAAKAGLSLEKAAAAVSVLEGEELQELASHARQVDDNLAGGASNIVISTTTIIIILLIVILIVLIAK